MSSCEQLYQLLSIPSVKTTEQNNPKSFINLVVGTAGFQLALTDGMETNTYNESTNKIIRAMAACQLGLDVSTGDDTSVYKKPENKNKNKIDLISFRYPN